MLDTSGEISNVGGHRVKLSSATCTNAMASVRTVWESSVACISVSRPPRSNSPILQEKAF
jgi:hypothetical protein